MNNLDLNAMGVSEMSNVEMRIIEGGSLWSVLKEAVTFAAEVVALIAAIKSL